MSLIGQIERFKLMVAVRTETPEKAYKAAMACIHGGIRLLEITFSVPEAGRVITKLQKETDAKIGAGTILSISDATRALESGASYIVSPHCDEEIIRFTKKEGLISIPGASTPSEIFRALRAGGDIIKLFPFAEMGGLHFLNVIRGPFPFVRYMLCGGITKENVSEYLQSNPSCILVGSAILKKELVEKEEWKKIEKKARIFVETVEHFLSHNT